MCIHGNMASHASVPGLAWFLPEAVIDFWRTSIGGVGDPGTASRSNRDLLDVKLSAAFVIGNHVLASEWTRRIMKHNFRRLVPLVGAMVGILAMGMATPARAGLVIQLSTDGVTWTPVASAPSGPPNSAIFSSSFAGFDVNVLSVNSSSPGTSSMAFLEGSALHITNSNTGIATLYIRMGDVGFTAPTNPPAILMDSEIGGSVTVSGTHNSLTFQSYVDPANGQNSQAGFTTGPQTPNITGSPKSYNTDTSTTITGGLTSMYSITEYFKLTLSKGSQVGFQSSTTLSAVPEPSSLVLSCIGVLGLVGLTWRQKASKSRRNRDAGPAGVRK